jgi:thymidylate synthase
MFSLIAIVDSKLGISKDGKMPWNYPEDLKYFKNMTKDQIVIMGNNTWNSLPNSYRPLPNRINVVLTQSGRISGNTPPNLTFTSISDCVEYFSSNKAKFKGMKKFVIGGSQIYKQFLERNLIHDLFITSINKDYKCDLFMPYFFDDCVEDDDIQDQTPSFDLEIRKYYTINHEENQMLNLMNHIIKHGNRRDDRTDTGTLSVFSRELRFNLKTGQIPLLTTRPLSLKIIFEELMWILRGQTDNKILNEKKINIWNDNTSREFLDSHNLQHYEEGDIGASYGFQMRHYGEKYVDCHTDYKGFDQLENAISLIKHNPESRRIIINLWNPSQLDKMSLPPCVYGYQFYVANGRLNCKLLQRSSDIALAGGHNCAAGAMLTIMIAAVTRLLPGELIWSPSDIHIYLNQVNAVKEQLTRHPKPFPLLRILKLPENNDIRNFELDHFKLLNYDPHPRIKFEMNA